MADRVTMAAQDGIPLGSGINGGPELVAGPVEAGVLPLYLAGDWRLKTGLPTPAVIEKQLEDSSGLRLLTLDASDLGDWDSGLLAFLVGIEELCRARRIDLDTGNLPEGARRLLRLATAVPERQGARRTQARPDFLTLVGTECVSLWQGGGAMLGFIGEAMQSFSRLVIGHARFRHSDLVDIIYECGAAALPIITLISFLVGLILAFVGAIQLQQFGAQIYVADLVGIAMAREMGALMSAIIMSGRTGAAFAAQLGTMQVNEEIDALTTLGISPIEFLVLPRMLALAVMMPLLALYADLLGLLGGMAVGVGMLDLGVVEYYLRTIGAIGLDDCVAGLIKASVFGVLIAMAGCLRGIQCGRSSAAVGAATTSAVVTGIVLIIVSDAATTVIFDLIGL